MSGSVDIRQSHIVRLFLLGVLTLVLQVPIVMIALLAGERADRRSAAAADIASTWGGPQSITGPALVVPYEHRSTEVLKEGGRPIDRVETRRLILLPDRLTIGGPLNVESRQRGIFTVPVYTMRLQVEGTFSRSGLATLGIDPSMVAWDRAELALGVSDARAIQDQVTVTWNDRPIAFVPGVTGLDPIHTGIHAPIALVPNGVDRFTFPLVVNGSTGAYFAPFAEETVVQLTSNSPNPNFQGHWLPANREVTSAGFNARWTVPYLGRDFPQAWTSASAPSDAITRARFGVELTDPVDPYRMADRSVKYAALFIMLTFASVWLVEVMADVRVHPIQYLFIGAALCLFYLLELSLSEHMRFGLAYGLSTIAIVAMVTAYCRVALGKLGRMLVVGAGTSALYGYLYVVLTDEDTALLVGALGLFVALGLVMIITRRIDWYRLGRRDPAV